MSGGQKGEKEVIKCEKEQLIISSRYVKHTKAWLRVTLCVLGYDYLV